MRLKPGRPDISRYASRLDVPVAGEGPLAVTFLGVSTLLVQDGESAVMTDGFFSRPGLLRVGLGRVAPSAERIDAALDRALGDAGLDGLDAVMDKIMGAPRRCRTELERQELLFARYAQLTS